MSRRAALLLTKCRRCSRNSGPLWAKGPLCRFFQKAKHNCELHGDREGNASIFLGISAQCLPLAARFLKQALKTTNKQTITPVCPIGRANKMTRRRIAVPCLNLRRVSSTENRRTPIAPLQYPERSLSPLMRELKDERNVAFAPVSIGHAQEPNWGRQSPLDVSRITTAFPPNALIRGQVFFFFPPAECWPIPHNGL